MPRIDNIKNGELAALVRNVRTLGTNAPIGFSSVTKGGLRIASSQGLLVQGSSSTTGTANVSGTQSVTGTANNSGVVNNSGTINNTGTSTNTGQTNLNGPVALVGTQTVSGGGKIVVGPLTISPTGTYGSKISCSTNIELAAPTVVVSGNLIASGAAGANTLSMLTPGTTTSPANVFVAGDGQLLKVTSAAKYKYDPQPMVLPGSLLDVRVKDWFDSGSVDRFAETLDAPRPFTKAQQATLDDTYSLKRVPGVIAEEVAAAGGEAFVNRSADGEIEGVAYDRFALARTGVLADEQAAMRKLISGLQKQVNELSATLATLQR